MKLPNIKIWHLLLIGLITLIVIRMDFLISLFNLFVSFISLALKQTSDLSSQINFSFLDSLISFMLIISLPVVLIIFSNLRKLLKQSLNFSSGVILILVMCFVFAPIITKQNPDFQKNISVTKLLPPFSSVKYLTIKNSLQKSDNEIKRFVYLRKKVIPESFNDYIIFIDSLNINQKSNVDINQQEVLYYQAGVEKKISLDKLESNKSNPIVKSKLFIMGTDEFGRDIFTRIIYGSRISLIVGIGSVLLSLIIGLWFAFITAQKGGLIDLIISRITDLFLSFPTIFLVIIILALFGNNLLSVIIVLGLSGWMSLFKVVKSEIASIKKKDYFISAELIGLKNKKLLTREILPVIIAPVIVNLVFQFSNVILAESALSYLGLGTGTYYPSWGAMIEAGQEYITKSWWMIFIPGFVLVTTLLSINNLGRKLNEYYNPEVF